MEDPGPHILIRQVTSGEIREAAAVLARAFADAPRFTYLFPDAVTRPQKLRWYYSTAIKLASSAGPVEVAVAGEDQRIVGVAIWDPPDGKAGLLGRARSGIWLAPFRLGLSSVRRRRALRPVLDSIRPSVPCWFLSAIGVEHAIQRSGFGTALLESMLQRMDDDGFPCFLDTSAPGNLAYYERFGFAVTAESVLPNGIPVWGMTRGRSQEEMG